MTTTRITSTSRKCVILATDNTNQMAEELQYNIAGKTFIVGYTYPDGRVRGYIQLDKHTLKGVYILNAEDVA